MQSLEECYAKRKFPLLECGIADTRREPSLMSVFVAASNQLGGRGAARHDWARSVVPVYKGGGVRICCEPDVLGDWVATESDLTIRDGFQDGGGVTVKEAFQGNPMRLVCSRGSCEVRIYVDTLHMQDSIGKALLDYFVCELQFLPGDTQPVGKRQKVPTVENICGVIRCDGLRSGVVNQDVKYTLLGNITLDKDHSFVSFRGSRQPAALCEFAGAYIRPDAERRAYVSMVVLTGWKRGGNCVGDMLERSLIYQMGEASIKILPKTDASVNLTKFQVLRWGRVYDHVRDGSSMRGQCHQGRPGDGDLQGNQVTVSYTGAVMVQFHFGTPVPWSESLRACIEIAARMCMQLVDNNC